MSGPPYTIREALCGDLPSVADLCRQWAAENLTRGYRADSEEELAPRLGDCFLVAAAVGRIVGFVIGQIKPTKDNEFVEGVLDDRPSYLEVQDLYVAQGLRSRGIGTRLLTELLARAKKAGVGNSLVYSANRDYRRTAAFYEKVGFEMWHIHMTRRE
jgi:ribosomal protein S18 acetylase RimI-like enzyme